MRTIAPAKINWTLEVLGRREDGYHEIRSVMQTIDLCDELWIERSASPSFETADGRPLPEDDLIVRAARALEEHVGRELAARIRVEKRIPVASGLGGGSSDAAAVLRLLTVLYQLGLSCDELAAVGSSIGSDVPFFMYGGTALVEGRGERVTPLKDARETSLVVGVPAIAIAEKTKRMFQSLDASETDEGSRSNALMRLVENREPIDQNLLYNAFDRVVQRVFRGIDEYRRAFREAVGRAVHLCGAGPAMFAPAASREEANAIASRIVIEQTQVFVAEGLPAAEATVTTH